MENENQFTEALLDHIDEQQAGTKPLLFRCHSAGNLLTDPKTLKAQAAGLLSETAMTLIHSMWLQNTYGYREILKTDAMDKGNFMEQDSMKLTQEVLNGPFRTKNRERLRNDYIIGTPDIITATHVEDIKTCWSLRTFHEAEPVKLYTTQAQCYMELTGRKSYKLIYCLVPNTDDMILKECERVSWQYGHNYDNADYIAHCQQIKANNDCIGKIPAAQRVKVFEFAYDAALIAELYVRIERAREYYKTIQL